MRIELRRRIEKPILWDEELEPLKLAHNDLLIIFEKEDESQIIDQFGQPGTKFVGEVRLADGYGEHYLMLQPTHIELGNGDSRDIPQDEATK
jgi:hypothetical protein